MITKSSSMRDVAFEVCTALHGAGSTAVLSGGGAATLYAPEIVQSYDLDFIVSFRGAPGKPLLDLGFEVRNGIYRHPDSAFLVEFPPGPLAIGDEIITTWSTLRDGNHLLHMLNPTDCVRDRSMWFYVPRATDFSALEQALGVARSQEVDLDLIRDWSIRVGASERFEIFLARL